MTIAYVGNFSQRHCTEVHLAATLEAMGHKVTRIQETVLAAPWVSAVDWASVDLFLYTRTWGNMVTLDDLDLIKDLGVPSASCHLDLYVGLGREDGLDQDPFWRTDYVFTPDGDPASQAVFEAKGINHHYIKPGVYGPECYIAPKNLGLGPQGYRQDVVFVGGGSPTGEGPQYGHSEWPYRGQLLKFLSDTYGNQFSKFGWPQETIRNEELNQLYAETQIVVGDSLCLGFGHPYYWSDRVYETIGRGGFIIHPYIKGMEEEFTDGETIVFYEYNNWDQLRAKINYYLEHDQERERIRKAGHEFVKNNATYTQRLQQMLDIIFPPMQGHNADVIFLDEARLLEREEALEEIMQVTTPEIGMAPSGTDYVNISLGAGTEIEEGWINADIVPLPGIGVVHNLMQYPWPWADKSADYIKAKDIIEHMATHLPDGRNSVIAFIEECHRILKPGGTLWIQTPSWDADFLWIDPTHVRGFDIRSFDFFDPDTDFGRSTGFYSDCKFKVDAIRTENGNLQVEMVKR